MSKFSFNTVPVIRHSRSSFDLSHGVKTSGNVGTLYPFDVQEIYPGDTFKTKTACVSRLACQFFRPVMDNLFLDVYYFFVPSRLLYDKFVNIFGENTESAWANTKEFEAPHFEAGTSFPEKTVADYMGITPGVNNEKVSLLPFRAFAKVYNEWFRDQNNIDPMHIQYGEKVDSEVPNSNEWGPSNYTGKPPKVAKFHDLFTSALPSPQKGDAPSISLGGLAPVSVQPSSTSIMHENITIGNAPGGGTLFSPHWYSTSGGRVGGSLYASSNGIDTSAKTEQGGDFTVSLGLTNVNDIPIDIPSLTGVADLSKSTPFTVNDLRYAFAYQRLLEKSARGGSRFVEYIAQNFGVSAGDYRLQRSEFLGGKRMPMSIHQVTQTTGSDTSNPLGAVGAYGHTVSKSRYTKGFTEHGYVIGVYCIRQMHTYQYGLERFWNRTKRTEFYDPTFAHIGEQPIKKTEIFASAEVSEDKPNVFGYGEAWYDLRCRQNRVTGQMRSSATDSLDIWHFADEYANAPVLSQQFIEETPDYVDRAITVDHSKQDQFILDFWLDTVAYRTAPTFSVPSLIDHD